MRIMEKEKNKSGKIFGINSILGFGWKPCRGQSKEKKIVTTPGLLASYSHIHIQIFGEIINNLGK